MKPTPVKASDRLVLTVNGGSSSIKFAGFALGRALTRVLQGEVRAIGTRRAEFRTHDVRLNRSENHSVDASDHKSAARMLLQWVRAHLGGITVAGVGHRFVYGGADYWQPRRLTAKLLHGLGKLGPLGPGHLPAEIMLARAFQRAFPRAAHFACFDTAFHHDLPRVAQLLPIPRRYFNQGVRRYGFHGLSCEYITGELARLEGKSTAPGRVIIAHLGNGASLTAVCEGRSKDTSMSFTPASGLVMSTRAGDLDPGLAWHLARTERMTPRRFQHMINRESGLLGLSGASADMSVLLAREHRDPHAAEAVAVFCHQARKWLCALAGVLGGVDTVVFSGGIGENVAAVRQRICADLGFLGIRLDASLNRKNAPVISSRGSPVTVRVIPTDEEQVIARTVGRMLRK